MTVRVFGASRLPAGARRPRLIAAAVRAAVRRKPGELNVVFVDARGLRRLNRRFLRHDYDTDVIAFRYEESPKGADAPFGDIFISADQARRQAKELGHPLLTEVLTLAIHGALHLAGYDDNSAAQRARMFKRQETLLRGLIGSSFR